MLTNYEFFEEIGRGPGSVVHRGHDLALDRSVAIKVVETDGSDPSRGERYWRDLKSIVQLKDKRLVLVHHVEPERGWIVMELLRGSLQDRLRNGPMNPELVRSILEQALKGLDFLHQRHRRLHGAIKPSNLLVDGAGAIKLGDARGVMMNPASGVVLDELPTPRTPGPPSGTGAAAERPFGKSMAPELLDPSFGPVGPSLDLYLLGFTALELLLGPDFDARFPGIGASVDPNLGWMRWHGSVGERLAPVAELVPSAPRDVAMVLDAMLQKQVAHRVVRATDALAMLNKTPMRLVDPISPDAPESGVDEAEETQTPVWGRTRTVAFDSTFARLNPGLEPPAPPKAPGFDLDTAAAWLRKPKSWAIVGMVFMACLLLASAAGSGNTSSRGAIDGPISPRISIATVPPGATIELGGALLPEEVTPAVVRLEPGTHRLILRKPGYEPLVEERFTVQPGAEFQSILPFVLVPKPVSLRISSTPPGADVELDGEPVGQTPATRMVRPGSHVLTVRETGFKAVNRPLDVPVGADPIALSYRLEAEPREVLISTSPQGASLEVDGSTIVARSPARLRLAPGKHQVRAALTEHEGAEFAFEVEPGAEAMLVPSIELKPIVRPAPEPAPVVQVEPVLEPPTPPSPRDYDKMAIATVEQVLNPGVVFVRYLRGGVQAVRLRGITSPRDADCAAKAREKLKELVLGRVVYLDRLPEEPGLVDLHRLGDAVFINYELVATGFATVLNPSERDRECFLHDQDRARHGKLGLWRECNLLQCRTSYSPEYAACLQDTATTRDAYRDRMARDRRSEQDRLFWQQLILRGYIDPTQLNGDSSCDGSVPKL